MRYPAFLTSALALAVLGFQACDRSAPFTPEGARPAETRFMAGASRTLDVEACAFGQTFTLESSNDYFPLGVGSQWSLEGEEDDALIELRITVLDEIEVVGGVTTRVVEEAEWEDSELIEISRNFFAETEDGIVCYFGEDVDIFEDGEISHEGAWRADSPGNFPGIIMPADPRPGVAFVMEGAPGTAEDQGRVVGSKNRITVPAGTFDETIRIRESNPLDGDFDFKVFAKDVGILIDGPLSLLSYTVTDGDE